MMRIKACKDILIVLLVVFTYSCNNVGIMNSKVRYVKPEEELCIKRDTTIDLNRTDRIINPVDIQIIESDYLIAKCQPTAKFPFYFYAFDISNFNECLLFGRKGRGSDELIEPRILKFQNDNGNLWFYDNTKFLYRYNPCNNQMLKVIQLPSSFFDITMASDTSFFYSSFNGEIYCNQASDFKGEEVANYAMNPILTNEGQVTVISSQLASCLDGKIVEAMVCLPQVNIYDIKRNSVISIAVEKSYKKWKTLLNRALDASTRQYYMAIAPSSDYIFAVYSGATLAEIYQDGGYNNEIHIFDWDGNFKYRIKIDEHLSRITFDEKQGQLYGIEKETGHIVRYNIFNN